MLIKNHNKVINFEDIPPGGVFIRSSAAALKFNSIQGRMDYNAVLLGSGVLIHVPSGELVRPFPNAIVDLNPES